MDVFTPWRSPPDTPHRKPNSAARPRSSGFNPCCRGLSEVRRLRDAPLHPKHDRCFPHLAAKQENDSFSFTSKHLPCFTFHCAPLRHRPDIPTLKDCSVKPSLPPGYCGDCVAALSVVEHHPAKETIRKIMRRSMTKRTRFSMFIFLAFY